MGEDPTSHHYEAYGCQSSMEGNGQGTISVKLESHYDQQNYQHTVLSISYELLIMQVLPFCLRELALEFKVALDITMVFWKHLDNHNLNF